MVYFEATRDGVVDREGEMVAQNALWDSRQLMLDQGDCDIAHFAHLPNPLTGRPQPEYRIGHPTQVTRQGKSIFVAGEIYRSGEGITPPEKDGKPWWPDYFWHSIAEQSPPAKWFPSVFGKIAPGGIEVITVKGQQVRRIVSVAWYSVGFALRAQHPALGPVSLSPVGNLAKADQSGVGLGGDVLHLPWSAFAKASGELGQVVTDHAAMSGHQALLKESLDKQVRKVVPSDKDRTRVKLRALRALKAERIEPTKAHLTRFFRQQGAGQGEAEDLARELLSEINSRIRA